MAGQVQSKSNGGAKKRYWLQLSGKGLMLWFCLVFLVSGWMFVLGVLVGRGTAPVSFDIQAIQKELIALKESMLEKEKKLAASDLEKGAAGNTFEFYEALRGKNKPEEERLNFPAEPQPKPVKKAPAKAKENAAPSAAGDARQPNTVSSKGNLAVQVASTKDPESAARMVAELKRKGYAAFSVEAEISGKGVWHRVRVGYFYDKTEAESTQRRLQQAGYEGIIVRK